MKLSNAEITSTEPDKSKSNKGPASIPACSFGKSFVHLTHTNTLGFHSIGFNSSGVTSPKMNFLGCLQQYSSQAKCPSCRQTNIVKAASLRHGRQSSFLEQFKPDALPALLGIRYTIQSTGGFITE